MPALYAPGPAAWVPAFAPGALIVALVTLGCAGPADGPSPTPPVDTDDLSSAVSQPLIVDDAAPGPRREPLWVWDATGERMLAFGGRGERPGGGPWALRVAHGVGRWQPLAIGAGAGPDPTQRWVGGFDPVARELVLFAMRAPNIDAVWGDAWAYAVDDAEPSWRRLPVEGRSPNLACGARLAAGWDPAGSRMVGLCGEEVFALTAGDGGARRWASLAQSGPRPPNHARPAAWDEGTSTFAVASTAGQTRGAIWLGTLGAEGVQWLTFGPIAAPPLRDGAMIAWNGETLVMLGGVLLETGAETDETWIARIDDGAVRWTRVPDADPRPSARRFGALAWRAPADEVWLFGGQAGQQMQSDVWRLTVDDDPRWSAVPAGCEDAPPAPRPDPLPLVLDSCNPTLSWTVPGDVEGYTFSVVLNGERVAEGLTDTRYTPRGDALRAADNTWSVSAHGCPGARASAEGAPFDVRLPDPPSPPTLVAPENLGRIGCGDQLTWRPSADCPDCAHQVLLGDAPPLPPLADPGPESSLLLTNEVPPGRHLWRVRTIACDGTTSLSDARTVEVHHPPPAPQPSSPAGEGFEPARPTFVWSMEESVLPVVFDVYVDGARIAADLAETRFTVPADTPLSHGPHRWQIAARGCGGESRSAEVVFAVDALPPEPFALTEPAEEVWFRQGRVHLQWGPVEDDDSGVAGRVLRVTDADGAPLWTENVDRDDAIQAIGRDIVYGDFEDEEALEDWDIQWPWHRARGPAGHWTLTPNINGRYDNNLRATATLDEALLVHPDTDVIFQNNTCTHAREDVLWLQARVDGGEWESIRWRSGVANDNWNGERVDAWARENSGRLARFRLLFQTDESGVQSPCEEVQESGVWVRYLNAVAHHPEVPDGRYRWQVTASDAVGNTRVSATRHFGIDRVRPSAPVVADTLSGTAQARIEWVPGEDDRSGIIRSAVLVDGENVYDVRGDEALEPAATLPPLADGVHRMAIAAVDRAGNATLSEEARLHIDTTPPSRPRLVGPTDDALVDVLTPELCWLPSDDGDGVGVEAYRVRVDDVVVRTVPHRPGEPICLAPLLADGRHTWSVIAVDRMGHIARSDVARFVVDAFPPAAFRKHRPFDRAVVPRLTPELCWFAADDAGSGIDHYRLEIFDAAGPVHAADVPPGPEPCATSPRLEPGAYHWQVTAVDRTGATTEADNGRHYTMTLAPDREPPTCVITAPIEGEVVNEVVVRGTAADASGIARVELCLDAPCDGRWIPTEHSQGEWSHSLRRVADGERTLRCRATDREGNTGSSGPTSFVVDDTPPERPRFLEPLADSWTTDDSVVLRWAPLVDAHGPVAGAQLNIDGELVFLDGDATSHALAELDDAPYRVTLFAIDRFGSVSAPARLAFGVDTTAPQAATLIRPAAADCLRADDVRFDWQAGSDATSGIATERLWLDDAPLDAPDAAGARPPFDAGPLAHGPHRWSVESIDHAGHATRSAEIDFAVDETPPRCTILSVDTDGETSIVRGTAVDDGCGGLVAVRLYFGDDHVATFERDDAEVWDGDTWQAPIGWGPGEVELSCEAVDGVGLSHRGPPSTARQGPCSSPRPCVPGGACFTVDLDAPCDDGLACTADDRCTADAVCVGAPLDCSGLDGPCGIGFCAEAVGGCTLDAHAPGTACGEDRCSIDGTEAITSACDGDGACVEQVVDCGAGHCAAGACDAACAEDATCRMGAWCDAGTCSYANRAPSADAGPDQTVGPGRDVVLDGRRSTDADGDALTFSWRQVYGPMVDLTDFDSAVATFAAPEAAEPRTLVFELVVRDGDALTRDATRVEVDPGFEGAQPVALIRGPESAAPGEMITLDGRDSTGGDSDPLTFTWSQEDGPPALLGDTTADVLDLTVPLIEPPAELRFALTVDDGSSTSPLAHHTVRVVSAASTGDGGLADAGSWPTDAGDGGDANDDNRPAGCACDAGDTQSSGWWMLGLVALLASHRRRAIHRRRRSTTTGKRDGSPVAAQVTPAVGQRGRWHHGSGIGPIGPAAPSPNGPSSGPSPRSAATPSLTSASLTSASPPSASAPPSGGGAPRRAAAPPDPTTPPRRAGADRAHGRAAGPGRRCHGSLDAPNLVRRRCHRSSDRCHPPAAPRHRDESMDRRHHSRRRSNIRRFRHRRSRRHPRRRAAPAPSRARSNNADRWRRAGRASNSGCAARSPAARRVVRPR